MQLRFSKMGADCDGDVFTAGSMAGTKSEGGDRVDQYQEDGGERQG